MDDTMKMWDLRRPGTAVYTWPDLINLSAKTGITLSPDEKTLLTGTSVRSGVAHAFITGFSTVDGSKICETAVGRTSVIALEWHHTLNQIFVGSADANITVLYDPDMSQAGIMRCITRQEKRQRAESSYCFSGSGLSSSAVYNPSELQDELIRAREEKM